MAKYPAQDKLSCSTGLAITLLDYWFPPEEPRRSQRMPGGVWFVGSPPITETERNLPMNDPTPTQILTAPAPTVTYQVQVQPHTKSGISESYPATATVFIKEELAKGKISPEQAQKAFAHLDASLEQREPDTRSEEAKVLDA